MADLSEGGSGETEVPCVKVGENVLEELKTGEQPSTIRDLVSIS